MIPTAFEYERAATVDDALARLAADPEARLLAGGHSLIPLMKLRLSEPSRLIDIVHIPELSGIREEDGRIVIGAAATYRDLEASPLLRERCPMLAECAASVGDAQVRAKGTVGGSLAHADPAADLPAALLALDAAIHLQGPEGARESPARAFFLDLFTTDLRPGEMITAVTFQPVRAAAYAKLAQKASHYALVGVAAALEIEAGVIRSARVAITGAPSHAQRLPEVEARLAGRPAVAASVHAAAAGAGRSLDYVNSDLHASEEYRRAMVDVMARRALESALARA